MFGSGVCVRPSLTWAWIIFASIAVWLPLVLASQTPAVAATTAVLDQRAELLVNGDMAANGHGVMQESNAPFFTSLCQSDTGRWAQTVTSGMTAQLSEVELLLLRRSPDIASPVQVEIRTVDDGGLPTDTVLGVGSTAATIPVHRFQPGWLLVALDTPVQLRAGQKVVIFPTSTPSAGGACYEWPSAGVDLYRAGSVMVSYDLGASFSPDGGKDAAFRTWMR